MKDDIRIAVGALALALLILASAYTSWAARSIDASAEVPQEQQISIEGQACQDCHKQVTGDLVHSLEESKHAANGVDCFTCHDATNKPGRTDVLDHRGVKIVAAPTFQDCLECHAHEIPRRTR